VGQVAGADIGVVLDDFGLLVLDPDGAAGGQALAEALAEADVVLPPTYEERTGRTDGRTDGGRHLFLWLPPGSRPW